jgi:hypothetical protein
MTRPTCTADHLPPPRAVGIPRSFKPAAIARSDVEPASRSALMVGAKSTARTAARSSERGSQQPAPSRSSYPILSRASFARSLRQARRGCQAGLQLEQDACAPDWLSLKYHRRLIHHFARTANAAAIEAGYSARTPVSAMRTSMGRAPSEMLTGANGPRQQLMTLTPSARRVSSPSEPAQGKHHGPEDAHFSIGAVYLTDQYLGWLI